MTHQDTAVHISALESILLRELDIQIWLALLEDELQAAIPETQLLARFRQSRSDGEKKLSETPNGTERDDAEKQLRLKCIIITELAIERLKSHRPSKDELSEEVERIIQKGYFKSVYFRVVLGGMAFVLFLVTGVEGYRLNEQVKAMQQLVEAARKQVEDSKVEIAKSAAETKDRQAQLALALIQGNEEMVKLRTDAMTDMSKTREDFDSTVRDETERWKKHVIEVEEPAASAKINEAVADAKIELAAQLGSTIGALSAADKPWVPVLIWSSARSWWMVPAALLFAILAWASSIFANTIGGSKGARLFSYINFALLMVTFGAVFLLK
jgi:hypothetical protein